MASSSEKEAIMPRPNDTETDLEEVHQLNGLFLDFLRSRVRTGGDCLGLPVNAARLLGKVPPEHLEAIVAFPTALFRLDLDVLETPRVLDPAADLEDPAKFALQHSAQCSEPLPAPSLCCASLSRPRRQGNSQAPPHAAQRAPGARGIAGNSALRALRIGSPMGGAAERDAPRIAPLVVPARATAEARPDLRGARLGVARPPKSPRASTIRAVTEAPGLRPESWTHSS